MAYFNGDYYNSTAEAEKAKAAYESDRKAEQDKMIKKIKWGVGAVIAFILFLIFNPVVMIGTGERGVVTQFGKVQDKVYGEGVGMRMPIRDSVHVMKVQTETVKFDNGKAQGDESESSSLFAATKDLQDVQIAVVVNYHKDPTKVNLIYQQFGDEKAYTGSILEPIIRETVKATSSQYTAEEMITKRADFSEKVSKTLTEKLAEKHAIFERLNIVNFQFSDAFNKAIEAKVAAEQNALAAKNKLEQVKFEADQRVAQAKAEAEAIKIQAEAIQNQGGAEYVNLKAIEKWNGILPQVTGAGSVPFIGIGDKVKAK